MWNWNLSYSSDRRSYRESSGLVTCVIVGAFYVVALYTFAGWLLPA